MRWVHRTRLRSFSTDFCDWQVLLQFSVTVFDWQIQSKKSTLNSILQSKMLSFGCRRNPDLGYRKKRRLD